MQDSSRLQPRGARFQFLGHFTGRVLHGLRYQLVLLPLPLPKQPVDPEKRGQDRQRHDRQQINQIAEYPRRASTGDPESPVRSGRHAMHVFRPTRAGPVPAQAEPELVIVEVPGRGAVGAVHLELSPHCGPTLTRDASTVPTAPAA